MLEGFRLGGWGMYPTAFVGFFLVATAVKYARQPERRRLDVVRTLSLLTFLTSALGFVTGVIRSFLSVESASPQDLAPRALVGVGESLHNLGLGLMLLVVATLVVLVGRVRTGAGPTAGRADLTDPHAP